MKTIGLGWIILFIIQIFFFFLNTLFEPATIAYGFFITLWILGAICIVVWIFFTVGAIMDENFREHLNDMVKK
jgi:L-lactate permease